MAYFFNGRLWTSPAVMSVVDDAAMFNPNPNVGNVLAILGSSTGGVPNTALPFTNPADAVAALGSGDLVDAITRAFNPSQDTVGPSRIVAIRVNPAVQGSLALKDGAAATVINLASTDYGLWTNQIKVKVEAGSTTGAKLTTQFGSSYYTADNVARNAFALQYTGGQATSRIQITNSTITLEAPNATVVATIPLATYSTVQQVVDRINAVADFTATVSAGSASTATLNGLDTATNADIKTAVYTATANLQAIVDWFNGLGEGYLTATRPANVGTVPANIGFTYLTGGTDGAITNTQWTNAFTALQSVDCQWVVPLSNSPTVHAMADTHVQYMSSTGRQERRAIVGCPSGTTDAAAIALAATIGSDRTSFTHLGGYDYNAATGALQLYEPMIVAAMVAGGFAGLSPGVAMTNKALRLQGMERNLRNPADTDALINGGILAVAPTRTGIRVVQSISTWLTNTNYNRVEQSVGAALDYTVRAAREAVSTLKGAPGNPQTIAQAASLVESALRILAQPAPAGPGILVGDAVSPAYKNITVTLQGNVLAISFQASPVIPVNYIPITVYAQPYSGRLAA